MEIVHQNLKEEFLKKKAYYLVLCGLAILMTAYACFTVLPLFNTFFVDDDFMHMGYAYELKHDPLSFFVWNYGGWWRPLGYLFPSLIYIVAGFNPFPFHLFAFFTYFVTGLVLTRFCFKLRDLESGLIAYCFFIAAPSLAGLMGFSTQATQDGLSTILFLLALTSAYRLAPERDTKKPYVAAFLFLLVAILSKDSWIGLIPALVFVDFINYPHSSLGPRIRRLYLFALLFVAVPLRIVVIGEVALQQSAGYMEAITSPNWVMSAFSNPFFPYLALPDPAAFNLWELIALAIVFTLSVWLARERRKVTLMLWTAFSGLAIILIPAGCFLIVNWPYHIMPLLAVAVTLISFLLLDLIGLLKKQKPLNLLIFIVLAIHMYLLYPITKQIVQIWYDTSVIFKRDFDSFSSLIKKMPKDTHIYSFQLYSSSLVRDYLLRRTNEYTLVSMKGKQFINREDFISGNARYVIPILKEKSLDANSRFIAELKFEWCDITAVMKKYLNGQADELEKQQVEEYVLPQKMKNR